MTPFENACLSVCAGYVVLAIVVLIVIWINDNICKPQEWDKE